MTGRRARSAVIGVAVLMILGAVGSGVVWFRASRADAVSVARARDDATTAARRAAVALSTLDYKHPERAVGLWHRVATGDLLDALTSGRTRYQKVIAAGKVTTRATVKAVAPQSLSGDRSAAVVLVGLDVEVSAGAGKSVEKERLVVTVQHTADGWRASGMKPVGS